jgi:uncharacterized delta-60 repeat protein
MGSSNDRSRRPQDPAGGDHGPGKHVVGLRYALKRMLGRGSLGEVWLAWDREREREVALKFLPAQLLREESCLETLRIEVERASRLQHRSIARVYDFASDTETVAIGMEYVPGWSLALLREDRAQKRYSVEEVRPWAQQICAALAHAHEREVVHGDLKPANLLLDARETIKVTDFVIGHRLRGVLGRQGNRQPGNLPYVSPQQLAGVDPKISDDIYSFGVILYELLTGTPPFHIGDIVDQIRHQIPPLMTGRLVQLGLGGAFPEEWEQLVATCLAKDPAQRPANTREILLALEQPKTVAKAGAVDSERGTDSTGEAMVESTAEPVTNSSKRADAVQPAGEFAVPEGAASAGNSPIGEVPDSPVSHDQRAVNVRGNQWQSKRMLGLLMGAGVVVLVALGGVFGKDLYRMLSQAKGPAPGAPAPGTAGTLDSEFNCGAGADGEVRTIAIQPDGRSLVGGAFGNFERTSLRAIVQLDRDGKLEQTFAANVVGTINAVVLHDEEKILIGGQFNSVGTEARQNIARLYPDGSLDPSFDPATSVSGEIRTLLIDPGGKILVGGSFETVCGHSEGRIARLNADGRRDASFATGTGANKTVWTLALQSNGGILCGGDFTSFDGQPQSRIARLDADGSLDAKFARGLKADGAIYAIRLQDDGKILIGGAFGTLGGTRRTRLARLAADGTLDPTFDPGDGPNGSVRSICLQPDGKVLAGGAFKRVQGLPRYGVVRLNEDGTLDPSFDPGRGATGGATLQVLTQGDGKILIGGAFTRFGGTASGRIARLNSGP